MNTTHARTPRPRVAPRHRLMIALAGALMLLPAGAAHAQTNNELIQAASDSRAKGADDAAVVVYEIGDFQCPYCARFSDNVFPDVDSAYIRTGRVRWVFINLPLPSHPAAWSASEAALCAGAVGDAFWPVHDRLFAARDQWSAVEDPTEVFTDYAREAGVPVEPFRECLRRDRVAPLIVQDVLSANSAGVQGTPTFFINQGEPVVGVKTFEEWKELLEAALAGENGPS